MHIDEVLILKELVDRISDQRANAEHRTEHIRSRTQIANLSEEFHRMALRLQRVVRCGCALYTHLFRLDFKWLLRVRCQHHFADDSQRGADIGLRDFFVVVKKRFFIYDLYGFKERTIVQFNKAELIGISVISDPALDQDLLPCIRIGVAE